LHSLIVFKIHIDHTRQIQSFNRQAHRRKHLKSITHCRLTNEGHTFDPTSKRFHFRQFGRPRDAPQILSIAKQIYICLFFEVENSTSHP